MTDIEQFYKNHYIRLREVFDSLTEIILGSDYYNWGMDSFTVDEYTGEELAGKYGEPFHKKQFKEKYAKILKTKAQVNDMRETIEKLEAEKTEG